MKKDHVKIFLFPHQDDELGAISSLLYDSHTNCEKIFCFYLSKSPKNINRTLESKSFLSFLKIKNINLIDIGDELKILDQKVIFNLSLIYKYIFAYIRKNLSANKIKVYTPSYEGGHPDHDSAYIIGKKLVLNYPVLDFCTFPLYNAENRNFAFFNAFLPLSYQKKNSFKVFCNPFLIIRILLSPFIFKSQYKAIFALYPFFILRILFGFYLTKNQIIQSKLNIIKPHSGELYYEKRKWMSSDFAIIQFETFLNNQI